MRTTVLFQVLSVLFAFAFAHEATAQNAVQTFVSDPLASTEYMIEDTLQEFQRECNEGSLCVFGPLRNDLALQLAGFSRADILNETSFDGDFDIGGCQYLNEVPSGELYLQLMDSAYWHYYRNVNFLTTAGYPESIWRDTVNLLFSSQVDEAVSVAQGKSVKGDIYGPPPGMARFVQEIALATFDYRNENGQMLPAPGIATGSHWDRQRRECGGDAFTFARLQASPTGGQIRLMSMFSFEFCNRTVGNPFLEECGNWTYVGSSDVVDAGIYALDVAWPDGSRACFVNRSLDDDRALDAPEGTLTYVIEYDSRAHCG
jgi:hypothetical protein